MTNGEPMPVPVNVEAEQALLGAILLNNVAFERVSEFLRREHFSEEIHARIYDAVAAKVEQGRTATPLTIDLGLSAETKIGPLTVPQYLARLCAEATSVLGAPDYAAEIVECAARRQIISIAQQVIADAQRPAPGVKPEEIISSAEASLFDVGSMRRDANRTVSIAAAVTEAIDLTAKAYQADGRLTGITWGVEDIDRLTQGLHAGELVILAGRPGMGKSAVAVSVARAAAESGMSTVLFSLEMSSAQLGLRLVSEASARHGTGIAYSRLRAGQLSARDFDRCATLAKDLEKLPLYIEDGASANLAQIGARVRRHRRNGERSGKPVGLVVVDYLQLVRPGDRYGGNRTAEVTEISAGLKRIARDENVAVLALSQLSRQVESREDKRPTLSDLRDSGSIEQDADAVAFLYRDEYYLKLSEPKPGTEKHIEWQTKMEAAHGKLDFILSKQRHGPTGAITVGFDPGTNRVFDLADDRWPRPGEVA